MVKSGRIMGKGGIYMENELSYKIKDKYIDELLEIQNILTDLENGRVYELTGAKMDGFIKTDVQKLKRKIAELLSKIQNGQPGIDETIAELFVQSK
jgi:predicted transcriptional regulator